MHTMSPGRILLADTRVLDENAFCRRATTSFDANDPILFMHDELLAGAASRTITIEKNATIIILPITGDLKVGIDDAAAIELKVEEAMIRSVPRHTTVSFSNPFATEVINYLVVALDMESEDGCIHRPVRNFSVTEKNYLQHLLADSRGMSCSIGVFDGRCEVAVDVTQESFVFAFVIAGAFEVEGRLLHERDGLFITTTTEAEVEALSNNAIVLIVKVPTANGMQ